MHDDKIWVVGGQNSGSFQQDVWSTADGTNWVEVLDPAPWSPRSEMGLVSVGATMWMLAGKNGGPQVWKTLDGSNWTMVTSSVEWGSRANFGCATDGAVILIAGGSSGSARNDTWSGVVVSGPTSLVATVGAYTDRVSVVWTPVLSATRYSVYRNEAPDLQSAVDISGAVLTTSYHDVSAIPGQLYTYWVAAGASTSWFGWSSSATGYSLLVADPDDRKHWKYRHRKTDVLVAKRLTLPIAGYLAEGWTLGISDASDGTVTEGPHVMSTQNDKKWKFKGATAKIIYVEKFKKKTGVTKGKLRYKTTSLMPLEKGIYFGPPK
jgi:hypothetical protein